MRCLRLAIWCVPLTFCWPADLRAQTVEAGASIATSCKGSDGSFCNDTHSGLRTVGPYASVWFGDGLEVGGRVVWLRQPDLESRTFVSDPLEYSITDRRRTIAQGEVIWHFWPGKRVRLMLGGGAGVYWDRELVTCQPPGCESRLSGVGLVAGRGRETHRDTSVVVGLSTLLVARVRLRGGWRYHNPFKDELALSEVFIAAGYRFGKI